MTRRNLFAMLAAVPAAVVGVLSARRGSGFPFPPPGGRDPYDEAREEFDRLWHLAIAGDVDAMRALPAAAEKLCIEASSEGSAEWKRVDSRDRPYIAEA